VDVAIIAALPEEMAALERVLNCEAKPTPLPDSRYRYCHYHGSKGWKRLLLVTLNSQGGVPAAAITWDVLEKWRPAHVLLVGVAGGDPNETEHKLGDVVVGEIVVGYEVGKLKRRSVSRRPRTYEPDHMLRDAAGQAIRGWPKTFTQIFDRTDLKPASTYT
jgi:nucleoside phosphorylase